MRRNHQASVCLLCVKELDQAANLRSKCLEADIYFRSTNIKNPEKRNLTTEISDQKIIDTEDSDRIIVQQKNEYALGSNSVQEEHNESVHDSVLKKRRQEKPVR